MQAIKISVIVPVYNGLIRRANSMMTGEMLNQISNRRHLTRSVIAEMLNFAKELGIYPIRGERYQGKPR